MVILVSTVFSGMATLLNVFVINLHFHRPEKPVPRCIKRLILGKLARVLGFTQYGDENEVQKIDIRNDEHGVMNGKGKWFVLMCGGRWRFYIYIISHPAALCSCYTIKVPVIFP